MGKLRAGLERGKYAYSSHSVFVSGDIVDVFVGKWADHEMGRVLVKCPEGTDESEGELMLVLHLRRAMTIAEYQETPHPMIRPLVKFRGAKVEAVLMPADMACTIPDSMEIE